MNVIRNPQTEPEWDTIGIHATDFRRHFDGDFVNVYTCISTATTKAETEQIVTQITREMANWILAHRADFGKGDKFQLIVAWPETIKLNARQIIKTGGDYDALVTIAEGTTVVTLRPGWDTGIF